MISRLFSVSLLNLSNWLSEKFCDLLVNMVLQKVHLTAPSRADVFEYASSSALLFNRNGNDPITITMDMRMTKFLGIMTK